MTTVAVEIRSRRDERVLYTAQIDESIASWLRMRVALEKATRERADLSGAYLRGADDAKLTLVGQRPLLAIGLIGSRCDDLYAFITDAGVYVRAGCFFDTLAAFREAVTTTHGTSDHGREYAAAIAMIETHAAIWTPAVEQTEAA